VLLAGQQAANMESLAHLKDQQSSIANQLCAANNCIENLHNQYVVLENALRHQTDTAIITQNNSVAAFNAEVIEACESALETLLSRASLAAETLCELSSTTDSVAAARVEVMAI
jgi:hypothetical protein